MFDTRHLKTRAVARLSHLLLLACLLQPMALPAASLSGRVISVPDANRVILLTQDGRRLPVALIGLETPPKQSRDWRKIGQRQLHMLLAGRTVSVEYETRNKQGVILGRVDHGGADMGLRLLRSGLAMLARDVALPNALQARYQQAVEEARRRGMGYWQSTR